MLTVLPNHEAETATTPDPLGTPLLGRRMLRTARITARFPMSAWFLMAISINAVPSADADQKDHDMLSVERLFSTKEFDSQDLGIVLWSKKSASYITLSEHEEAEPQGKTKIVEVVSVDIASGKRSVVVSASLLIPPGHNKQLPIASLQLSRDEDKILIYTNNKRVWRQKTRGDYWSFDSKTKELKQIGGDASPSTLMFAKFSPDGSRVAYVRDSNIYTQDLSDMHITPLTTDGAAKLINGTSDWVNEEELGIRDGYRWSPDSRSIAFWQFNTTEVPEFHLIDNTAGLYPRITSFPYPKVGQVNSAVRIGVVDTHGGNVLWLDIPGDPRQHYLPEMEWSPDGKQIMLQQLNRPQNSTQVMLAEAQSGTTRTVLTETDAAWVDSENPVSWLKNGQGFLWLSERDGWRHAYMANCDGNPSTLITPGKFDVLAIEAVDEVNGWVYFSASPENPTQRYLYRTRLGGGIPERLSPANQPGWHTYHVSPDATWATHTYSTFTSPPVIELIRLNDHRTVRTLVGNTELRSRIAALRLPKAEFFRVDIGGGVELDSWCLFPPELDRKRKHPMIFHVYGEPAGQTVRDAWGGPRELWHWMLAQQGYIIVSVDSRGTQVPRGREWRKSVFHKIGIVAPAELAAAAKALLQRWDFADPDRVGVWGWSGGGSNTLHAIFRYPDIFQTAIAVAPNANQLLYDSIYQERYMGDPKENAEGYRLGSPITYADQLRGNLLLVHGTGDDNGHFQGTEALINKLIANNKRFTVMPYPARTHSLMEGDNTVPHFYNLMSDYFYEHLPLQRVSAKPPTAAIISK